MQEFITAFDDSYKTTSKKITSKPGDEKYTTHKNVKPEDFIQLKCLSDASSGDIKLVTTPSEMQAAFSAFFPEIKYNFEKTNILNSKPGVLYKNFMFETTQ